MLNTKVWEKACGLVRTVVEESGSTTPTGRSSCRFDRTRRRAVGADAAVDEHRDRRDLLAGKGIDVVEVDCPNRQARHRAGKTDAVDAIAGACAALTGTATGLPKSRTAPSKRSE